LFDCPENMSHIRIFLGVLGVTVAAVFLTWLLIGWIGWVPAMVDVFGVAGMRTPAAITVAGLLLAAIAFHEC
jgi:hypothetical protein